ncbi:MAG TPA: hypothetical protein V6C72_06180, partial [Chroococcales cyanobacterium]
MSERKGFLAYAVSQLLVLVAFYWRFLTNRQSFFFEDITQFFEPLCTYMGREIAHGHLPLWNPLQYCGMPQIAVGSPGLFYPTSFLFACFRFDTALAINCVLHQWLCGIGAFLIVSTVGWGLVPAFICGAVMAMNGYMFSATSNYTLAATAAWTPLCIWSFIKIMDAGSSRWRWMAVSSVFVALMLAAGRPEIYLPSVAILVGIGIYARFAEATRQSESWLWQFRSLMVGALLAMPAILPGLEWASLSRRAAGMLSSEVLLFSANWYDFLCMIAANPLGDLQQHAAPMRSLVMPSHLTPYLASAFVGPVTLALAVLA